MSSRELVIYATGPALYGTTEALDLDSKALEILVISHVGLDSLSDDLCTSSTIFLLPLLILLFNTLRLLLFLIHMSAYSVSPVHAQT